MKESLLFRNRMAEQGIEMTPAEAETALASMKSFMSCIENMEYGSVVALVNMTAEEKNSLRLQLNKQSGFMSPQEFEELIQLIAENR